MNELLEQLADQEHTRWSHWMTYLFSQGTFNEDGTWTMPGDKVKHWQRQMLLDYADLTEQEKASDRAEARHTLWLLGQWFSRQEMVEYGRKPEASD